METTVKAAYRYTKTKYPGVRKAPNGKYQVAYYPFKGAWKKEYKTIDAKTDREAHDKRLELMVEARKQWRSGDTDAVRLRASFEEAWLALEKNLTYDKRPLKTIHHFKRTYNRMFMEYRKREYADLNSPSQLSLPFFMHYKDYYYGELGRDDGAWRTELTFVKAVMRRLYRLGYCTEGIIIKLKEMTRPKAKKKAYPDIPADKMKVFLKHLKEGRLDIYRLVLFMLKTGRRVEESTLIEKTDVCWRGTKPIKLDIRAETTKMKEKAPLEYFDREMEDLIRDAYEDSSKHKAPYLFLNALNRKMNQKTARKYIKLVSKDVLGVEITPHYFRHRFITECAKEQLPYADVMAISGLKDMKVLIEYYSHTTSSGQAKVLAKTSIR